METQISRLQLMYLMIWVILGTGIVLLPFAIAQFTINDGWMVPFFFFGGTIVAAIVCVVFIRTFPNQSLANGLETAFGPWLGRLIGVWMMIFFFVFSAMLLRELTIFVEVTSLPETPMYLISATILVPISYGVFQGVEVVGRVAEFLTPVALMIGVILAVLSIQNADFSQIQPALAHGWTPVLRGSVLPATSFPFEFIVVLQFVKSMRGGKTLGRDLLWVGASLTVFGVLVEMLIISVLGPSITYLSLPVAEVIRGIRIGEFVQRFDTIYVMGVIATMVLKISVFLYAMSSAMQDTFRLPTFRNVVWPNGIAIWTASILFFHNSPDLHEFMVYVTPAYFSFTLVLIPILAVVTFRLKKVFGSQ